MSTTETWRTIPGFPDYEASDQGYVRRATPACGATVGRILKPTVGRDGRLRLVIKGQGLDGDEAEVKGPIVARLILLTFKGEPPSKSQAFVRYHDDDMTNVALANLYWGPRRRLAEAA